MYIEGDDGSRGRPTSAEYKQRRMSAAARDRAPQNAAEARLGPHRHACGQTQGTRRERV